MNKFDINDIRKLLEQYYRGATTEAEESVLKEYFAGDDVDAELKADRDIFRSLSDTDDIDVPDDLADRLSVEIDNWDRREKRSFRFTVRAVSIAASLALLVALGAWFMQQPKTTGQQLSPEEAYAQTEKALTIFAKALDKSIDGLESVDQTTEKINLQINTHLKQLNDI